MGAPQHVAVIGLGRMGGPMADNLIAKGHQVAVFDVSPAAVASRRGARAATSPADAAAGASVVCVVVFDDAQAIDVVCGEHGALDALAPGAVVCVHTTASVETVRSLHARCAAAGVDVIDAGISGGEAGAQAGTLLSLCGGDAGAVERARPVLEGFSREVVYAGPLGAGMALKLARNAVSYAVMVAAHESVELAMTAGVDKATLCHVIESTGVASQGLLPFSGDFTGRTAESVPAELRDHLEHLADKDLAQALALADELGTPADVLRASRRAFPGVVGH